MAKISAYTEEVDPNPDSMVIIAYGGANFRVKLSNVPAKAWTSFTPTLTGVTIGGGTLAGSYVQIGKTIHFRASLTLSTTTITGAVSFSLPVTAAAAVNSTPVGLSRMIDANGSQYIGAIVATSTTTVQVRALNAASTYLLENPLSSTVPFTWADGDVISIEGTYEAA